MAIIKPTIQHQAKSPAMPVTADPTARLLRAIRDWAASQGYSRRRQLRVAITLAKTEKEIARLLVLPEWPDAELPQPARTIPDPPLGSFEPTELQLEILTYLADGPKTSGRIAGECGVSTGRLFDRGKVMHELLHLGLVVKEHRGYALTEAGRELLESLEE